MPLRTSALVATALLFSAPPMALAATIPEGAAVSFGGAVRYQVDGSLNPGQIDYLDQFAFTSDGSESGVIQTGGGGEFGYRFGLGSGDLGLSVSTPDDGRSVVGVVEAFLYETLAFDFGGDAGGSVALDFAADAAITFGTTPGGSVAMIVSASVSEFAPEQVPFQEGFDNGVFDYSTFTSFPAPDNPRTLSLAPGSTEIVSDDVIVIAESTGAPAQPEDVVHLIGAPGETKAFDVARSLGFSARADRIYALSISYYIEINGASGISIDALNSAGVAIAGVTGDSGAPGSFTSASALFPGSANRAADAAIPLPAPLFLLPTGLALLLAAGRRRRRGA